MPPATGEAGTAREREKGRSLSPSLCEQTHWMLFRLSSRLVEY